MLRRLVIFSGRTIYLLVINKIENMSSYKLKVLCKAAIVCVVVMVMVNTIHSQDLLANGDFEDTNACKKYGYGCAPSAWFRYPPVELALYLRNLGLVHEGEKSEIIIVENRKFPSKRKVSLYSMLLCPLKSGEEYTLSLYLNPTYDKNFKLEVVFTDRELINPDVSPVDMKPDITFTNESSSIKNNKWIKLEAKYIAKGDEVFINFGNFSSEKHEIVEKDWPRKSRDEVYYLVDNISLTKTENPTALNCDPILRKKLLYSTFRRHTLDTVKIYHKEEDLKKLITKKEEPKTEISHAIPHFAFEIGESNITDVYYEVLDKLVSRLDTLNIESIEITGHTDNTGDSTLNQLLSEKRANSIHKYLTEYIHVEYKVSGKGETEPRLPNTSAYNRMLNRRVELEIKLIKE